MRLGFDHLRKNFGGHTVFENISGEVNSGDVIGLIGDNGVGKTTLAKILAGLEPYDSGRVQLSPGHAGVFYLEQFPAFQPHVSVYDVVFQAAGGNAGDSIAAAKKVLNKMGLREKIWAQKAATLSGGEKTKLSLCKVMVSDFDFLLMDEPSNHLDMESCEALEEYILNLGKPLLVISHDRYLLDRVTNKIWELTARDLKVYEGNYSIHRDQKDIEARYSVREYQKQQSQMEHLRHMISHRKDWYASAHKSAGQSDFYRAKAKKHTSILKAKEKELEKLEQNRVEKPQKAISPAFEVINRSLFAGKLPRVLVRGEDLSKRFGEKTIFEDASFYIMRGDKVALIGQNGSGKTTFLRILCRLEPDYKGSITISPSVKIGYFAQELEHLNNASSILDHVLEQEAAAGEARLLLASLLFKGDAVFKRIGSLSMGEKGRVAFARLILSGANMLVLDEPTNYMDILSREKIEEVLAEFKGALLFVSHDRYFIKKLANRIFQIKNRKLFCHEGNYDYYLAKSREARERSEIGIDYNKITDAIRRLECELAFLSGQLNSVLEEEEKARLNSRFLQTSRELNAYKAALEKRPN